MSLFLSLFLQLLPLYTLVGVGYIAARFLAVKKTDISRLLIYVLTPAVSFGSIVSVHLSAAFLSLPLLSFVLCTCIAGIILFVGKFIWHDGTANMLSVGIANGNFGFIGLPLAAILLGQQFIAPVVLFGLGAGIFIATLGIYITARANFNARESFYQVLKMPMVYAFAAGILANYARLTLSSSWHSIFQSVTGAYSILGLMLVGIALYELGKVTIDKTLIAFTVVATYVLWPAVAALCITLDRSFTHFYNLGIYRIILLLSIVPVGASIVALSTELRVEPQKAAFVVLLTTVMSLFYVPLFFTLFHGFLA